MELNDINLNYNWWEFTYEDAKNIGLKITSFDLDRNRHAKGEFILSACEVAQNILNEHGENCETYKTAQNFLNEFSPVLSSYMDENSSCYEDRETEEALQNLEDGFLTDLLENYSIILQNEYDYLCSEKAIIETILANDYTFLECGTLSNY